MLKRLLWLGLFASAALGLLAGCGDASPPRESASKEVTAASSPAPTAREDTTSPSDTARPPAEATRGRSGNSELSADSVAALVRQREALEADAAAVKRRWQADELVAICDQLDSMEVVADSGKTGDRLPGYYLKAQTEQGWTGHFPLRGLIEATNLTGALQIENENNPEEVFNKLPILFKIDSEYTRGTNGCGQMRLYSTGMMQANAFLAVLSDGIEMTFLAEKASGKAIWTTRLSKSPPQIRRASRTPSDSTWTLTSAKLEISRNEDGKWTGTVGDSLQIHMNRILKYGRWKHRPAELQYKDYAGGVLLYTCDPYSREEGFCGYPSEDGYLAVDADPPHENILLGYQVSPRMKVVTIEIFQAGNPLGTAKSDYEVSDVYGKVEFREAADFDLRTIAKKKTFKTTQKEQ